MHHRFYRHRMSGHDLGNFHLNESKTCSIDDFKLFKFAGGFNSNEERLKTESKLIAYFFLNGVKVLNRKLSFSNLKDNSEKESGNKIKKNHNLSINKSEIHEAESVNVDDDVILVE